MNKPSVLILGDYSSPPYHPLKGVDSVLTDILSEYFTVKCTEDRKELELDNLKSYKLCISYVDAWEKQLSPEQVQGLCNFVNDGGGFLAIHNGISYQSTYDFSELIGAKFTSHPPYQKLTYAKTNIDHIITEGLDSFEMSEELYLFDLLQPKELNILMDCSDGSTVSPALWTKTYGSGLVVYLAPGHDMLSFTNRTFLELVERCALWASRMLP